MYSMYIVYMYSMYIVYIYIVYTCIYSSIYITRANFLYGIEKP